MDGAFPWLWCWLLEVKEGSPTTPSWSSCSLLTVDVVWLVTADPCCLYLPPQCILELWDRRNCVSLKMLCQRIIHSNTGKTAKAVVFLDYYSLTLETQFWDPFELFFMELMRSSSRFDSMDISSCLGELLVLKQSLQFTIGLYLLYYQRLNNSSLCIYSRAFYSVIFICSFFHQYHIALTPLTL